MKPEFSKVGLLYEKCKIKSINIYKKKVNKVSFKFTVLNHFNKASNFYREYNYFSQFFSTQL